MARQEKVCTTSIGICKSFSLNECPPKTGHNNMSTNNINEAIYTFLQQDTKACVNPTRASTNPIQITIHAFLTSTFRHSNSLLLRLLSSSTSIADSRQPTNQPTKQPNNRNGRFLFLLTPPLLLLSPSLPTPIVSWGYLWSSHGSLSTTPSPSDSTPSG